MQTYLSARTIPTMRRTSARVFGIASSAPLRRSPVEHRPGARRASKTGGTGPVGKGCAQWFVRFHRGTAGQGCVQEHNAMGPSGIPRFGLKRRASLQQGGRMARCLRTGPHMEVVTHELFQPEAKGRVPCPTSAGNSASPTGTPLRCCANSTSQFDLRHTQ